MLGEEFPEEKLQEIRQELIADAEADGALQLIQAQIQKQIMELTGMMPGPEGTPATPLGTGEPGDPMAQSAPGGSPFELQAEADIRNKLVTDAYGTKLPQRSALSKDT
jgi:hypothetical protein